MIIYLDIIFIVNFLFDLMILYTTSEILKLHTKITRLIIGSLVGSLTLICLFVKFNSLTLFLYKIIISIVIILVTFGKNYYLKKLYYFYFTSIILGGLIYLIKLEIDKNNTTLSFLKNNIILSILIYLVIAIVMLKSYLKQVNFFKIKRNMLHKVTIVINNKKYQYNGYIDTGNSLYDHIKKRPVLILYDKSFVSNKTPLYVPFNTLDGRGIIPCIKIDELYIDDKKQETTYLLGLANNKIKIKNVNANIILHKDLLNI